MLVDFLLSRQRIARYLFDSFRQPANLKKVLQARVRACGDHFGAILNMATCCSSLQRRFTLGVRRCPAAIAVLHLSCVNTFSSAKTLRRMWPWCGQKWV